MRNERSSPSIGELTNFITKTFLKLKSKARRVPVLGPIPKDLVEALHRIPDASMTNRVRCCMPVHAVGRNRIGALHLARSAGFEMRA